MKCIDCIHRGVCKYVEEDFRKLEKAKQWASQKIEIMEEKEACDLFEEDIVHSSWRKLRGYSKCNHCGQRSTIPTNYCPHCGAKMRGIFD